MTRLALLLLGLWLGIVVSSWVVATVNFRSVDRVLGAEPRPELDRALASVPAEARRMALRHLASEINRWLFRWGALVQLALGAGVLAAAWRLGGPRLGAAIALALLALQAVALTPAIVELGRSLDFVPRPLPPEPARRFGALHGAYVLADLAKAAALAVTAWLVARQG